MTVKRLLAGKGDNVVTVRPDVTVKDLLRLLAQYNIGAVVVAEEDQTVAGIVSERDIVRALSQDPGVLSAPVRDLMTVDVVTCELGQKVDNVMVIMTTERVRHMPVVEDGRLVGIISIGDVVKSRIDALEFEKEQLTSYLAR